MRGSRLSKKKRRLFIIHNLGLGDHFLCNAIYRSKALQADQVFFLVKARNFTSVKDLLSDVPNVSLMRAPNAAADHLQRLLGILLPTLGCDVLRLGHLGKSYLHELPSISFDREFYIQAGVPFEMRWKSSFFPRNEEVEHATKASYVHDGEPYVFVHDDSSRGYLIDDSRFANGTKVVRPNPLLGVSLQAHAKLIEDAREVHLMESSFLAMAQTLSVDGRKFVHTYIRRETLDDPQMRQTLGDDWVRLNSPA